MHSKNIRDMLINMYKELKNYNIIGTERKNFIYKISNIQIVYPLQRFFLPFYLIVL